MPNILNTKNNSSSVGSMLTTAIVTNNNDPDALGRIKVQYTWSDDESHWARISTLMAGNDRGLYFIPEVGEEVLVAFVNGDIQSPIVIGSLWNQSDLPPENNSDGENNIRKIRSRSGHEIIFDDSDGSEKITIKDSSGSSLEFDASSGSVYINSTKDVVINADANVSIETATGLVLKAGSNLSIEAGGELSLKGTIVRIN